MTTNPEWLGVVARHSGQYTWTLGYVFEQYRKYEGKSAEELAEDLGCSLETLDWLSLCRRPDEEKFAEHLDIIEKRFAVEAHRLADVIRTVEVLDVLPPEREDGEEGEAEGFLLAARDHSTDDETSS
jgi:transcriptional regulator with XRE-family HTH domain